MEKEEPIQVNFDVILEICHIKSSLFL